MDKVHWEYLSLHRENRVLEVTFRSPNKVNSLNNAMMRELTRLAQELQFDSELNAIILTGAQDIFSAGMDLNDPEAANASNLTVAQRRQLVKVGPAMCAAWEALEPVTIVAIEGWCIGGGTALAVACDWRVAADNASFYVPELKLGMNMSWQSVPRFTHLIGPAKTKRVVPRPLDAATARDGGIVRLRLRAWSGIEPRSRTCGPGRRYAAGARTHGQESDKCQCDGPGQCCQFYGRRPIFAHPRHRRCFGGRNSLS